MIFTLNNVANIKNGTFEIEENKLNIFYALNGTGKTSLTSAIKLKSSVDEKEKKEILSHLRPYDGSGDPNVEWDKELSKVIIFNEEYISQNLFRKSAAISNTYEIVVKTKDYEQKMHEIDVLLNSVSAFVEGNDFIRNFCSDIKEVEENFEKRTNSGVFHSRNSDLAQLNTGIVISRVPDENLLSEFIKRNSKAGDWRNWFDKGASFETGDDVCPYCGSVISSESRRDQNEIKDICKAEEVGKSLDSMVLIHKLTKYLKKEEVAFIEEFLASGRPFDRDTNDCIQVWLKRLTEQREKITSINPRTLKDLLGDDRDRKLSKALSEKRLDEDVFKDMDFIPNAYMEASAFNTELQRVIETSTKLSQELNELSRILNDNIANNQNYVNKFLDNAGMPYEIVIQNNGEDYTTLIKPRNVDTVLANPKKNLSYGETNALSLLLFSLNVRNQECDLIVLDDPISSFDNSKKFALMHQMFGEVPNQTNLRGRTVLMVTHDFQIVCDTIKKNLFGLNYHVEDPNDKTKKIHVELARASYLRNSGGTLLCKKINKSDIKVVTKLEKAAFKKKASPKICRMIHFRRYLELSSDMEDHKYNVVASWLHGDTEPKMKNGNPIADAAEMMQAIKEIDGMEDFDYSSWLAEQTESNIVAAYMDPQRTNVEKLEIVRTYLEIAHKEGMYDRILMSYLHSVCHIEGDLVVGLDQEQFDTMPANIISFCDAVIAKISK